MPFILASLLPFALVASSMVKPTTPPPVEEKVMEEPKEFILVCNDCTANEKVTMQFFQDRGIKDRNALATIMGNIRQESNFHSNICEGGARIPYHHCGRGYGLIQWTSAGRYYGLGKFAKKYGGNASSMNTQLRYLVNENQWKRIEPAMKTGGKSIDSYMNTTYSWIGWGHHGYRTDYAHDYANKFILIQK